MHTAVGVNDTEDQIGEHIAFRAMHSWKRASLPLSYLGSLVSVLSQGRGSPTTLFDKTETLADQFLLRLLVSNVSTVYIVPTTVLFFIKLLTRQLL